MINPQRACIQTLVVTRHQSSPNGARSQAAASSPESRAGVSGDPGQPPLKAQPPGQRSEHEASAAAWPQCRCQHRRDRCGLPQAVGQGELGRSSWSVAGWALGSEGTWKRISLGRVEREASSSDAAGSCLFLSGLARRPDLWLLVSSLAEAEPARLWLPRERGEEPKAQSEPEQGAAAEGKEARYEEGEEKEGGDVGAGAASPPDGESHEAKAEVEAEAGAGGGEGGEKGGEEQRLGAAVEVRKAADRRHRVSRHTFTLEQLRELEGVFHRTQYLSVALR